MHKCPIGLASVPAPREKPRRPAFKSLLPGACQATPDCAFAPPRGDLRGLSGCAGGALVLEDEKYMEVSFPLLQTPA